MPETDKRLLLGFDDICEIENCYIGSMTRVRKKDDSGDVRKVTWVGLVWNAVLSVAKFVVGVLGNSQALVADAVHSASDFATDIAVIVGSHFWNSPPDAEHPYGHRRKIILLRVICPL